MNNNITQRIIDFIKKNEISTAEISDALGKKGLFTDSYPLFENTHIVGHVFYVSAYGDSNWPIHYSIVNIPENYIVLIENIDCEKALFGEIVSKYIISTRKAAAIVTNGSIRDIRDIKNAKLPVWFKSVNPVGCFNSKPIYCDETEEFVKKRKIILAGSIAICDDNGVIVVYKKNLTPEFLEKLRFIKQQEEKWKECVFEKTWSTYETICLKRYDK